MPDIREPHVLLYYCITKHVRAPDSLSCYAATLLIPRDCPYIMGGFHVETRDCARAILRSIRFRCFIRRSENFLLGVTDARSSSCGTPESNFGLLVALRAQERQFRRSGNIERRAIASKATREKLISAPVKLISLPQSRSHRKINVA